MGIDQTLVMRIDPVLKRVSRAGLRGHSLPLPTPEGVYSTPILKTANAQPRYSDEDLHTVKELVSSLWESRLVLTTSFLLI